MLTAVFWGLIQGLTEFLPVSSSGHLVLIPALLGIDKPDLATSAVLHLGTLGAVVAYYRRDLLRLTRFTHDAQARRILILLIVGTIPAALVGLTLERQIDIFFTEPWLVAVSLVITGLVLATGLLLPRGLRVASEGRVPDAIVVGLAQAFALIPGISRSGTTITAAQAQGFGPVESARLSFLLAVPAIAGAGFIQGLRLVDRGGFGVEHLVGALVAGITGYLAIDLLVKLLARAGLAPFAAYCIVAGGIAYFIV